MMENDRLDGALDLVAFVTVRRDDVQDFTGNTMLVRERDAAERMTQLLPKFSLNDLARRVLVVFQRFADVGQQRTSDEIVALDRNAATERFLEHIGDGDALPRAGIEMLDEGHVDVAGQQRELDRAQFGEGPAFPAAACRDRFAPDCRDLFAQRFLLDLLQAGKELRDL